MRRPILVNGQLYCLMLTPDNEDGTAEWGHIMSLMRALYEEKLIDPDMVIIHPSDAQALLEILFRAGVLVTPNLETGQEVPADNQTIARVGYLCNVATGKLMVVSEKDDATPGQLAFAIQQPFQLVGILKGLKQHKKIA